MTVEQFVAVLGAVSVLLGAVTALFVQMRHLELRVDGRLTQLLELTKSAALAEGKLAGELTEPRLVVDAALREAHASAVGRRPDNPEAG